MMTTEPRQYTAEFKREAVRLMEGSGKPNLSSMNLTAR
jgi:transposase-like protein